MKCHKVVTSEARFFPRDGQNYLLHLLHLPAEGWAGWVGLSGLDKYWMVDPPKVVTNSSWLAVAYLLWCDERRYHYAKPATIAVCEVRLLLWCKHDRECVLGLRLRLNASPLLHTALMSGTHYLHSVVALA